MPSGIGRSLHPQHHQHHPARYSLPLKLLRTANSPSTTVWCSLFTASPRRTRCRVGAVRSLACSLILFDSIAEPQPVEGTMLLSLLSATILPCVGRVRLPPAGEAYTSGMFRNLVEILGHSTSRAILPDAGGDGRAEIDPQREAALACAVSPLRAARPAPSLEDAPSRFSTPSSTGSRFSPFPARGASAVRHRFFTTHHPIYRRDADSAGAASALVDVPSVLGRDEQTQRIAENSIRDTRTRSTPFMCLWTISAWSGRCARPWPWRGVMRGAVTGIAREAGAPEARPDRYAEIRNSTDSRFIRDFD